MAKEALSGGITPFGQAASAQDDRVLQGWGKTVFMVRQ
jgi:hypothetical protein